MQPKILVVDDDRDFLEIMHANLAAAGWRQVDLEDDPRRVAQRLETEAQWDIALVDMTMPEMDGMALLDLIKSLSPPTECIMVTAVNDARTAVSCLRRGAYDYLVKPVQPEELHFALERTLERKRLLEILSLGKRRQRPCLAQPQAFAEIVTHSAQVVRVLKEAELHAGSDVPILISGESGTGKELLARAIHAASARSARTFVAVNMASLTAGLFEAEFFGHTRGAFTGADRERAGFLQNADRGTLFLDEIGNLPLELQSKLLRVLQDGEYTRLGESRPQRVNVRIIAATNEDLEKMIERGRFRKDLYYRIRGGWLHLPPLRERTEDIPLLVRHFLQSAGTPANAGIDEEALCLLQQHQFPGNVRELKSILLAAVNLAQGGSISAELLPGPLQRRKTAGDCRPADARRSILPLNMVEKNHILNVYRQLNRNKSRTARILGIGLNTLRRRLRAFGED
jgi:two-component system response regulator AtoC